jgi:hypothetical protein
MLQLEASGLLWQDELGHTIESKSANLLNSPAVLDGPGMAADKLFDSLMKAQSEP